MNESKSYVDTLQLRALYCKSESRTVNAFKQIELCHLRARQHCSITQCKNLSDVQPYYCLTKMHRSDQPVHLLIVD